MGLLTVSPPPSQETRSSSAAMLLKRSDSTCSYTSCRSNSSSNNIPSSSSAKSTLTHLSSLFARRPNNMMPTLLIFSSEGKHSYNNNSSCSSPGSSHSSRSSKMSWTEKRISLPFGSSRSNSVSERQVDIEAELVLSGHHRKLKNNRRRWFVLYAANAEHGARLVYWENERKWRAQLPPSRTIILKECLNICKKRDTRDSKNRHVIAIYTLDDCLGILFEEEQELKTWLIELLNHQTGRPADGKMPKPVYENMWQVNVKSFKPEDSNNTFVMVGQHRLVVTTEDLKFFPVGSVQAIAFPIISLRSCLCNDRLFQISTGRSSTSGAGTLVIHCEDKEISASLNGAVLQAMEYKRQNPDKLPSHVQRSLRLNRDHTSNHHHHHGHHHDRHSTSVSSSSSHRPRSESCSEIDKKPPHIVSQRTSAAVLSRLQLIQQQQQQQQQQHQHFRVDTAGFNPPGQRYRTTSEGNHMEIHRRRAGGGSSSKSSMFSGSPMSPSPGSYVSSESAGSSSSLADDAADCGLDRRHVSMTDPPTATIFEESSAESWIDPSTYRESSTKAQSSSSQTASSLLLASPSISHARTLSDSVQYTPVEVGGAPSPASDLTASSKQQQQYQSQTQYAAILSGHQTQPSSSDYMVMTPPKSSIATPVSTTTTSASSSLTSSLRRNVSLDHSHSSIAEQRRLALFGLNADDSVSMTTGSSSMATTAAISPSSQSSHDPLLMENELMNTSVHTDDSGYHLMSPQGEKASRPIQISSLSSVVTSRKQSFNNNSSASFDNAASRPNVLQHQSSVAASNDDEYMAMSPVSIASSSIGCADASSSSRTPTVVAAADTSAYVPMVSGVIDGPSRPSSMDIPSRQTAQEYEVMSPVSVDPERLRRITEEDPPPPSLSAIEERLSGSLPKESGSFSATSPSAAHARSDSLGARRSAAAKKTPDRILPIGGIDWSRVASANDTLGDSTHGDYAPMDYSGVRNRSSSNIPIPASSVPSSDPRGASPRYQPSVISYLRNDDEDDDDDNKTNRPGPLPLRAYSVSSNMRPTPTTGPSSSNSSVSGRSRAGSVSSKGMDIPSKSRLSPMGLHQASSSAASGHSPTSSILSRLFFRSRAGSVPNRPTGSRRRRHRTQSEGEKAELKNNDEDEKV